MSQQEVTANGWRWVSIVKPEKADIAFLNGCGFSMSEIEDCLAPSQRSKLDRSADHLFLVLLFPYFNAEKKSIEPFEIDIFLTSRMLITVQDRNGPVLAQLFRSATSGPEAQEALFGDGPVKLLETILRRLLTATFPMIDHISMDVREIEQRLFAGNERTFLEELLVVRRNIAVFRKTMQPHKFILRKLANTLASPSSFIKLGTHGAVFENLVEYTKEIWDAIDIQKEEVETLAVTNESLISYRLNEIMKKFTTLSVMIFAMTLVASLFAVGAPGTPFLGIKNAFWYVVVVDVIAASILYGVFRRKRWL